MLSVVIIEQISIKEYTIPAGIMDCILAPPYVKGTSYHPGRGGLPLDICWILRAFIITPPGIIGLGH